MKIFKGDAMAGLTYGWIAMVALGAIVAFLGGSSRPDAIQLIALRPLAALMLIPALILMTSERLAPAKTPLFLLLALAALMALQLLPLPPGIWQALPGRAEAAEFSRLAGLGDVWRPLSMAPDRTLNAVASLVVPIAGLLVAMAAGFRSRTILTGVALLGVADAVIGILQVLGGGAGALYFYAITNAGTPVGIFANQNHSGVFSALVLIVIAHLGTDKDGGFRGPGKRTVLGAVYVMVLVAALLSGSRAALILTLFAVLSSLLMLWIAIGNTRQSKRPKFLRNMPAPRLSNIVVAAIFAAVAAAVAYALTGEGEGAVAIADAETFEDLRFRIFPVLLSMLATYWLPGAGFGAFEETYHIYEPAELLSRYYINQAHNDWLQFLIEGGLLGAIWLLAVLWYFAANLMRMARHPDVSAGRTLFWLCVVAVVMAASLVDYPLRTPVFQLALAWLAASFAIDRFRFASNR